MKYVHKFKHVLITYLVLCFSHLFHLRRKDVPPRQSPAQPQTSKYQMAECLNRRRSSKLPPSLAYSESTSQNKPRYNSNLRRQILQENERKTKRDRRTEGRQVVAELNLWTLDYTSVICLHAYPRPQLDLL